MDLKNKRRKHVNFGCTEGSLQELDSDGSISMAAI